MQSQGCAGLDLSVYSRVVSVLGGAGGALWDRCVPGGETRIFIGVTIPSKLLMIDTLPHVVVGRITFARIPLSAAVPGLQHDGEHER